MLHGIEIEEKGKRFIMNTLCLFFIIIFCVIYAAFRVHCLTYLSAYKSYRSSLLGL